MTSNRQTPKRLPVYLLDEQPAQIQVDGPALVLIRDTHAPIRYPVGRISRILLRINHEWSHDATMLCLAHRIPVLFVDADGTHLGSLTPSIPRHTPSKETIAQLVWHPDAENRLENWTRQEYQTLIEQHSIDQHPRHIAELKRRHVHGQQLLDTPASQAETTIVNALRCATEQFLQLRGLPCQYPTPAGGWWDLAEQLTNIIRLMLRLDTGTMARAEGIQTELTLTMLHQKHFEKADRCLNGALSRLIRLARDTQTEWP